MWDIGVRLMVRDESVVELYDEDVDVVVGEGCKEVGDVWIFVDVFCGFFEGFGSRRVEDFKSWEICCCCWRWF